LEAALNVPPFIPQPTEIEGNVTQEPYAVRIGFVRRVVATHVATAALVLGAAMIAPEAPTNQTILGTVALLAALAFVRTAALGARWEQAASAVLLPALIWSLGVTVRSATAEGWPAWAPACGLCAGALYVLFCGRDLSFVGMFVLGLAASSVAIVVLSHFTPMEPLEIGTAISLNALYLLYVVYDLASLLSRRRLGEEVGAAIDLYRDLLNFVGYGARVIRHWRRHRIWTK
jgi:FtsH-binding integral membrane protein